MPGTWNRCFATLFPQGQERRKKEKREGEKRRGKSRHFYRGQEAPTTILETRKKDRNISINEAKFSKKKIYSIGFNERKFCIQYSFRIMDNCKLLKFRIMCITDFDK